MKYHIQWFRRDIRHDDNHSFYHSLSSTNPTLALFIFDTNILEKLSDPYDLRVNFIYKQLQQLNEIFKKYNSSILVKIGKPEEIWPSLISEYDIEHVFTNHDYEPYALNRDAAVSDFLSSEGIKFSTFKDQVIFEKLEISKDDCKPYTVYTPYKNKWKSKVDFKNLPHYPSEEKLHNLAQCSFQFPSIEEVGFKYKELNTTDVDLSNQTLANYSINRDFPFKNGTSRISVHLRFGTVSVRSLYRKGTELSETWVNELIWREFYQMILWNFPHVSHSAFKPIYDQIEWENKEQDFAKWCSGKTGYPLVDAGMRELNETGFMHNRVRMVVASFLTKHLLIHWSWGEAYFAEKLLDFDLAANNGGWQWASSSGCDAAPYFRIFNPTEQMKKFDPELQYIRKWIPEFDTDLYPTPIIDHSFARNRALERYAKALKG